MNETTSTPEFKLIQKTNVGELFANWCFYSGLLIILFKLTGLGAFSTMSWWLVTLPWSGPFAIFGVLIIISLLMALVGSLMTRNSFDIDNQVEQIINRDRD